MTPNQTDKHYGVGQLRNARQRLAGIGPSRRVSAVLTGAQHIAMKPIHIARVEQGTVMSSPGANRIPAAAEFVKARGARYQHYGWPGIMRTLDGDVLVSASERISRSRVPRLGNQPNRACPLGPHC